MVDTMVLKVVLMGAFQVMVLWGRMMFKLVKNRKKTTIWF
jgi:hypothetical protein